MALLDLERALADRHGKRLVLTNGVFDILHAGHVRYLESARELGDLLFVGLNSDASVRMIKGPSRPIFELEDRAAVVAALACVDGVLTFEEKTATGLVEALKPEVYAKGGDYALEELPEAEAVQSYGGEVRILPLLPGRSTTEALRKLSQTPEG